MVSIPWPSLLVVTTLSPDGMLPQLRRQIIRGTGIPIALQKMVKVPPISTSMSLIGGEIMVGGPKYEKKKEK